MIGLDRTGRNPEVEEVLGALALLLNGGGVGQLKTIAQELNTAFDGRTDEVRSVLTQIREFMTQLDSNKESIVAALENTNRLAAEARKQDRTGSNNGGNDIEPTPSPSPTEVDATVDCSETGTATGAAA